MKSSCPCQAPPNMDSVDSGSEPKQLDSPSLVKHAVGFPSQQRTLIGSNQLWRAIDSPYSTENYKHHGGYQVKVLYRRCTYKKCRIPRPHRRAIVRIWKQMPAIYQECTVHRDVYHHHIHNTLQNYKLCALIISNSNLYPMPLSFLCCITCRIILDRIISGVNSLNWARNDLLRSASIRSRYVLVFPTDIWRNNKVIITSKRRRDVLIACVGWKPRLFSALPVDSPHKGPVMQKFDSFFVVTLNNLLNKQSTSRWFEIPWRSCNKTVMLCIQFCCAFRCLGVTCIISSGPFVWVIRMNNLSKSLVVSRRHKCLSYNASGMHCHSLLQNITLTSVWWKSQ